MKKIFKTTVFLLFVPKILKYIDKLIKNGYTYQCLQVYDFDFPELAYGFSERRLKLNIWHNISPKRISPDDFVAVIEIPKGSKIKYELDKETGLMKLDRILYTSTHYPANYGLIPRTYADDGDPLDVLLICSETLYPLTLVRCYPIGVIRMIDSGRHDDKIIAIPFDDPTYNTYKNIDELPKHIFDEMIHFFKVYKELENKTTAVDEIEDVESAKTIIANDIEHYVNKFCK